MNRIVCFLTQTFYIKFFYAFSAAYQIHVLSEWVMIEVNHNGSWNEFIMYWLRCDLDLQYHFVTLWYSLAAAKIAKEMLCNKILFLLKLKYIWELPVMRWRLVCINNINCRVVRYNSLLVMENFTIRFSIIFFFFFKN